MAVQLNEFSHAVAEYEFMRIYGYSKTEQLFKMEHRNDILMILSKEMSIVSVFRFLDKGKYKSRPYRIDKIKDIHTMLASEGFIAANTVSSN